MSKKFTDVTFPDRHKTDIMTEIDNRLYALEQYILPRVAYLVDEITAIREAIIGPADATSAPAPSKAAANTNTSSTTPVEKSDE